LLTRPGPETRAALLPHFERCGALHYAKSRAQEFTVAARQHLDGLPDTEARQILEDMADFVTLRSS
jgi:geranylgeranyl pyrophosphate synthase